MGSESTIVYMTPYGPHILRSELESLGDSWESYVGNAEFSEGALSWHVQYFPFGEGLQTVAKLCKENGRSLCAGKS